MSTSLKPGASFGRYRVLGRIGEGGCAVVYRVQHADLRTEHALKVLNADRQRVAARLLVEGRAQASLRHPNVVAVTDTVEVEGQLGLVMDLVAGPGLDELLTADDLTLGEVDVLARGWLAGVAAAHARGLVHRDLKPANVLVDLAGAAPVPKVADFGLARMLEPEGDALLLTREGAALGTPAYMPPEQIADARRADPRSDVFAAGAVLYEMLAGHRAFQGADLWATFDAIRAGRRAPLPPVPERMARAIDRALDPDPEARFPDAAALLAAWCAGTPTPTAFSAERTAALRRRFPPRLSTDSGLGDAPSVAPVPAKPPKRWRWAVGLFAGVAVSLALWAARPPARWDLRALTALPEGHRVEAAAISDDGRWLAWVEDGKTLVRRELATGEERRQELEIPHEVLGMELLDDGAVLLGQWGGGRVVHPMLRVEADGALSTLPTAGVWPRVSPDGLSLAWSDCTAGWVAPLAGGAPRRLLTLPFQDNALVLAWSPDSRWIAASVADYPRGRGELVLLAADGSRTVVLREELGFDANGASPLSWEGPGRLLYARRAGSVVELVSLALDAEAGTAEEPRVIHRWEAFLARALDLDAAGRRGVAVASRTDPQVVLVDARGALPPRVLIEDPRPEWVQAWLDPETLVVAAERESTDLLAVSIEGEQRALVADQGAEQRACMAGERLLFTRRDEAERVTLWAMEDGVERRLLEPREGPLRPVCASGRAERAWLRLDEAGADTVRPIALDTGRVGEPVWQASPGVRAHAVGVDATGERLFVLTGQELLTIELATGAQRSEVQELAYPVVGGGEGDEPWVVGGLPDGRFVVRRVGDGSTLLESPSQLSAALRSPDGAWLAVTRWVNSADAWSLTR